MKPLLVSEHLGLLEINTMIAKKASGVRSFRRYDRCFPILFNRQTLLQNKDTGHETCLTIINDGWVSFSRQPLYFTDGPVKAQKC